MTEPKPIGAVHYDPDADVAYVDFGHPGTDEIEGEEVFPGVMLEFDRGGKIVGIEITSARKILSMREADD